MEKYIFLDRDGTVNVEKHYLHKIEDFEFEYKVVEALQNFKELGYKFIVITNQSGIARGYYTENDFKILTKNIDDILNSKGIEIKETFYCPHHPDIDGECDCRKPNTKLFEEAIKKYNVDVDNSYMVGDKKSDLLGGERVGLKSVLVLTGHGKEEEDKINFEHETYNNLYEFSIKLKERKL